MEEDIFYRVSGGRSTVNSEQFTDFLRKAFKGADDDEHFEHRAKQIFARFSPQGEPLSRRDFQELWMMVLEKPINPRSALVVVDYQNDFIDGSLSLKRCPLGHDPSALLPRLNEVINEFDEVVYTLDWHPEDHISFIECRDMWKLHESNQRDPATVEVGDELIFEVEPGIPYPQKMWPRHCVQKTDGAKIHKDLKLKTDSITVHKGMNRTIDSYSAFWDNCSKKETKLRALLEEKKITNLYVVGLAFDACVSATAKDAIRAGFTTSIVEDLTAGISEASTLVTRTELAEVYCPLISSDTALELLALEKRESRPLAWHYVWQLFLRNKGPKIEYIGL